MKYGEMIMPNNQILSHSDSMKHFHGIPKIESIIDAMSDLKHRIFPRPFERLSQIHDKPSLVGIEIGVCAGDHAISLIENLDIQKLYCIDPYDIYDDYTEGKQYYGKSQLNLRETEIIARERLSKFNQKIVWLKKTSDMAILDINEQVDFVYIDGNHAFDYVYRDIQNYFPIIKEGGVLGGHDFYNGFQSDHDGVVSAVTRFVCKRELTLKVELPDWWINL